MGRCGEPHLPSLQVAQAYHYLAPREVRKEEGGRRKGEGGRRREGGREEEGGREQ